jgi:hypothetical protein
MPNPHKAPRPHKGRHPATNNHNDKDLYIEVRGYGINPRTLTYEITRIVPHEILGTLYYGVRVFADNPRMRTMLKEKLVVTGRELDQDKGFRLPHYQKFHLDE